MYHNLAIPSTRLVEIFKVFFFLRTSFAFNFSWNLFLTVSVLALFYLDPWFCQTYRFRGVRPYQITIITIIMVAAVGFLFRIFLLVFASKPWWVLGFHTSRVEDYSSPFNLYNGCLSIYRDKSHWSFPTFGFCSVHHHRWSRREVAQTRGDHLCFGPCRISQGERYSPSSLFSAYGHLILFYFVLSL